MNSARTLDSIVQNPSVLHPQSRMILLGFESRSRLSSHQLEASIFGILFECLEVGAAFGSIPETEFNLSNRQPRIEEYIDEGRLARVRYYFVKSCHGFRRAGQGRLNPRRGNRRFQFQSPVVTIRRSLRHLLDALARLRISPLGSQRV